MIEWENGETTTEPLTSIAADDPVTCALYAKENPLLDLDGWKLFKSIAKRDKTLIRLVQQAKLRSYCTSPKFKYGYEIPCDYAHALDQDKRNGNNKWVEATRLELQQLHEYNIFEDKGYKSSPPLGFKIIRTHLIFDCKHNARHNARMVADGHLTDIPLDSIYSGVVSLRGLQTLLFIADLNDLQT
jgi:hypothetical protein